LRLELWQRCPVAVGPVVMDFFGASLAYLIFGAHCQNRSCQSYAKSHLFGIARRDGDDTDRQPRRHPSSITVCALCVW
jgi:hypothetical protein